MKTSLVEVLAPAGGPDCLPAAVAGGAHAVFLGLRHFNARGRAENFRTADLPRHVAYLHHHGLKCYVVMNTLVHDDEYPKALLLARAATDANVDAVIVQDIGLWTALKNEVPRLKRHASTQMTIHDPRQIPVLARLGAERVILARELSLAEITECTRVAHEWNVETEVFVHGALCYAFSGQCLMSNFSGCRSANRGTCAQNCRFDYTQATATGMSSVDTTLSMKDLALVHRVAELANAGVSSLKIEGRLKGPEYVYTVSRVYRSAVDAWRESRGFNRTEADDLLSDVFSRTRTDAPLNGNYDESSRLHRYQPAQDRQPDAFVIAHNHNTGDLQVTSTREISAGQGFAFTLGKWNGGFLTLAAHRDGNQRFQLRIRSSTRLPPLPNGTALFRNADHERRREASSAMSAVPISAVPPPTQALDVVMTGTLGEPLHVLCTTSTGISVQIHGSIPLAPATAAPLDEARIRDSFGAFGGTGYHLATLETRLSSSLFIPASELKNLRRKAIEAIIAKEALVVAAPEEHLASEKYSAVDINKPQPRTTQLWVAVGNMAAAHAAFHAGADAVWLDDAHLALWDDAAPSIDLTDIPAGKLWLRHPATAPVSPHLAALGLPMVAGHVGVLEAAHSAGLPVIMDVFGNCFGWHTAQAYAELGAAGIVLSLECSSREVLRLASRRNADQPLIALVVHGRLPAMLTRQNHQIQKEKVLTITATPADGGLPYQLTRRQFGTLSADTVIWEGRRLCAPSATVATSGFVDAWLLELADLSPDAVHEIVSSYRALLTGQTTPAEVTAIAERHAPLGLFPGHLLRGSRELDAMSHDDAVEDSD